MIKALVLGASGGMGYAIVKELSNRGITVRAFARTQSKLEHLFHDDPRVSIFAGDLFRIDDLSAAASDVDIIFQSANLPYPEWEEKWGQLITNVVSATKKQEAKLAVVDNIYAYGRNPGRKVSETTPKRPHTKKGKIRLESEKIIKESGVKALIAHFPDFYGPNAKSSLFYYTLKNVVKNKNTIYIGNPKIARESIFTPDGAKAIVNLALNDEAYDQEWTIPASGVVTGEEVIAMIRKLTQYQKHVTTITKNMIRFLGLFNPMMREVVEMYYLNEDTVVLSGEKYEKHFGPVPVTPYKEGLRQTIEFMRADE
ncbi:NAD-dependent epimerase/dehydratase family protein [Sporolactobacillus sp. THM7-7]|nr:NAD-dependent epimerase/dehydratase family protein [Sporolactobacillus sp. THM7-7]